MPYSEYKQTKRYREASRDYSGVFNSTMETYLECAYLVQTGSIAATNPDPLAKPPLALTYRAEYVTDIECAVRRVLTQVRQQDCFDRMLREMARGRDPDPAFTLSERVDIIQLVGREIERRRLQPGQYFFHDKYKRYKKHKHREKT
jgi:hypothetical protein